jgi:predicted SAM-dependent methyltransferase
MVPHGFYFSVLTDLNVVGGQRTNSAKCPFCYSTERERLLFFYYDKVIRKITNEHKIKLLHIAPEKYFQKLLVNDGNIEHHSGDKYTEGYNYDSPFLDICDTGFEKESFDIIICNHVLEHVDDYILALNEIKRILKTGGRAVLQVPIAKSLTITIEDTSAQSKEYREEKFGQYDHLRLFGLDYKNILESAGFKVNVFSSEFLSDNQVKKYFLNPDENLYEASKPI